MKTLVVSGLCLVTLIGVFGGALQAEAAKNKRPQSILQENFNKYAVGSVIGQGGWIDRANGSSFVIQDTVARDGRKALYSNNTGSDSVITKSTNMALADGRQAFYIRTQNRNDWGTYNVGENVQVRISKGSWDSTAYVVLSLRKDGHVAYIDTTTDTWTNFDTYVDNAWTLVEIEWRSSDTSARFRTNNGTWTNWIPLRGASSFTDFDTIGLVTFALGTGGVYFDSLQ